MHDGPLSFSKSWEGFLPANAVVMARRTAPRAGAAGVRAPEVTPAEESESASIANVAPETEPVRFAFEAPGAWSPGGARDLFTKIVAAIGASDADSFVSESPVPS